MTDTTPTPTDPLAEAIKRALDAAAAATDAAHEAEAVLIARSDAARAMDRTARRSGILAAVAGGASVLVLVLGGLLWLRTSADLRDAGEVQAAAAVAFAERIAELNGSLDRMDDILNGTDGPSVQAQISDLIKQLDKRTEEILATAKTPPVDTALSEQIESLRADVIEAIAETQVSIATQLKAAPIAAAAPAAPAAAPAPKAEAAPKAAPPKPKKKPATSAAAAPAPNPFRYP